MKELRGLRIKFVVSNMAMVSLVIALKLLWLPTRSLMRMVIQKRYITRLPMLRMLSKKHGMMHLRHCPILLTRLILAMLFVLR